MSKYTTFISYSREDAATAYLLANILYQEINIKMDINMEKEGAILINPTIQNYIKDCDVFTYIVSQNSLSSTWVQQEIGYALALKIPILALSLSSDIKDLAGMLQKEKLIYNLPNMTDYTKNGNKIRNTIINLAQKHPVRELNSIFEGEIKRTQELKEQFLQIIDTISETKKITIYNMAAFSIFSISDDPIFLDYGKEYIDLLLEERELLKQLLKYDHVSLKLILYPIREYAKIYRLKRFENLLAWLEKNKNIDRIDFVLGSPKEENWYITEGIKNNFFLLGRLLAEKPGFYINTLTYDNDKIQDQIKQFLTFFRNLKEYPENENKQATIDKISQLYEELKNKGI